MITPTTAVVRADGRRARAAAARRARDHGGRERDREHDADASPECRLHRGFLDQWQRFVFESHACPLAQTAPAQHIWPAPPQTAQRWELLSHA
jgi:hypothetical protein